MNQRGNYQPRFWLFPFFAVAAALALGGVIMLLWNAVLPSLLGVAVISYWQSVGLLVLCRLLFGNFSRSPMSGNHRWKNPGGPPWRNKWANMTDEERARFREEWRKRCEK